MDEHIYESDARADDSSVQKLAKHKIKGTDGFGNVSTSRDESHNLDGHLLIGFGVLHAFIVIIPDEVEAFRDYECFTNLNRKQYEDIEVNKVYEVHITFFDKDDPGCNDYKLLWLEKDANELGMLRLGFYSKLFYVCDINNNATYLDMKKIGVSKLPEFYSTFYSDCLEYCKRYVKMYISYTSMPCTGQMINRIDALAITGTRIEQTSRNNMYIGVLGNRTLFSSTHPTENIVTILFLMLVPLYAFVFYIICKI